MAWYGWGEGKGWIKDDSGLWILSGKGRVV